MSRLVEYLQKEQELQQLQAALAKLEENEQFQRELEFKQKLEALMQTYQQSPTDVIRMLSPTQAPDPSLQKGKRTRTLKTYRNPRNGEEVQARSTRHKTLTAWIAQYGKDTVDTWVIREEG